MKNFYHFFRNLKQQETGRSMVEIIGVLAIMGVLSVGGIAGYRYAMDQIAYNKLLDIFSKFELMYFTEVSNWENSIFNVPDSELCDNYPSSQKGECRDFENEYFCNNYAGKQYCSNQVVTGPQYSGGYFGRYALSSGDGTEAWSWFLDNLYDNNCKCREVGLRLQVSRVHCEDFLMHVYHSSLRPYLGWIGWISGTWYFRSMSETSAQSTAKQICSDSRMFIGSDKTRFMINVRWPD